MPLPSPSSPSHSGLCRTRGYVVQHYVTFGVMSFGIMSHSALCCIRPYVIWLCVVRRIVVRPNVVRCNVVRPTVGVLLQYMREYNARSPKQDSKRFNSHGRQNTLPIWVYYLSMILLQEWGTSAQLIWKT